MIVTLLDGNHIAMNVAFVQNTLNQHIGVMLLSALAKRDGHQAELFVQQLEVDLAAAIVQYDPRVIGFSVLTGAHRWVSHFGALILHLLLEALIVVGGVHPTTFPKLRFIITRWRTAASTSVLPGTATIPWSWCPRGGVLLTGCRRSAPECQP